MKTPVLDVLPFVWVGVVPSVVYLSVVPDGMLTLTVNGESNSCASLSTTGVSTLPTANVLPVLLLLGVGFAVSPHVSPPSMVLANDVLGTDVG